MGGLSGSRNSDGQPVYLWLLVNGSNHSVRGVYGQSPQDTGNGISCFSNDSADSGSSTVSYYELDDDAEMG